jgi:hemolysin activation/secretion protein
MKGGTVWGDDNYIWFGLSPLDFSWKTECQHSKFFTVFNKSVFGYRLKARISPAEDTPLDPDTIRGIKPGEVRGNYIFYGNIDFRFYILSFNWPTRLELFIPLFFDFGRGIRKGDAADISKTIYTVGTGLRFYPQELGSKKSAFRFDIGVNMPDLLRGDSFENYIYIAFSFSEYF